MHDAYYGRGFNQRLRKNPVLRSLVREIHPPRLDELIYPLFICEGNESRPIKSMPGQQQCCLLDLKSEIKNLKALNINAVILFGICENKDPYGRKNLHTEGIIPTAIKMIKDIHPDLLVISDMCLCDYSSHGHCMILDDKNRLDIAATHEYLAEASLTHARAGADIIAPSGNVDHMVKIIRHALDENNFSPIAIMSYSAKYASALYAPFREACNSSPQMFDRKSYQLDPANSNEGLKEVYSDIAEGADIVMVKPANYLDILHKITSSVVVPVAAYQVSGEYAMIEMASRQGVIDKKNIVCESLLSIKRAGASIIITYFAKDYAQWLKQS
jgi:porphobilinogen synthase